VQIQRRNGVAGGQAADRRWGWRIALGVAAGYFGLGLLVGIARILGGDLWFTAPTALNALLASWVVGGILRRLRPAGGRPEGCSSRRRGSGR